MTAIRTVAILGAECCGKTALCQDLARSPGGLWLPELLRLFCARRGRTPRAGEQAALMQGQIALERRAQRRLLRLRQLPAPVAPWLWVDSAPLATALYSVLLFDDASLLPAALAHQRHYDATLLALPDLPWQADGIQRDGAAMRTLFHRRLEALLQDQGIDFAPVGGMGEARTGAARAGVARLIHAAR